MARKRAVKQPFRHENGFGSIVKLSGNRRKPFAVRITTGWENGKQVRKYLGYYTSEAEALMALAEYHKSGVNLDVAKLLLEEVFDRWYKRIENTISQSALNDHKMTKTRLGELGKKQIKDIKVDHIQDWLDKIQLKPRTKKLIRSTMNQVFNYAVQNDILQKNPVKFVKITDEIEEVGAVFTDEEIKYLMDNVNTNDDYYTILMLIYTGTRISELLDLRADNFHLEEGYAIGGKKTKAGKNRVIPFHRNVLPIVKERVEKHGCLSLTKDGKPADYAVFQHRFKRLMKQLGWNHTIHDTRKTAISLMHRSNIPIEVIRVIVGHSGKGVTERVYLYKNPSELVDIVNKIKI